MNQEAEKEFVNALVADLVTVVDDCFYMVKRNVRVGPTQMLWTITLFGRLLSDGHDCSFISYRDVYFKDIDLLILRNERFFIEGIDDKIVLTKL